MNQGPSIQPRLVVDGDFGARTLGRVKEFQGQKQLVPDGIVGPNTHAALQALYQLVEQLGLPTPPGEKAARDSVVNIARMAALMMGFPENGPTPPDPLSERIASRLGLGTPINPQGDQLRQGGKALAVIYAKAGHPFAPHCPTIPKEHIDFFRNTPNAPAEQKNARLPDWCGIFCLYVYRTAGLKLSPWPLRILSKDPEFQAVTRLQDVKPGDLCMVSPFGGRNHHFLVADFVGQTIHSVDGNAGKHSSIIQRSYSVASSTPDNKGAFRLNTPLGNEPAVFATPIWGKVL